MTLGRIYAVTLAGVVCAGIALAQGGNGVPKGRVVTVRMLDKSATEYLFEPAQVTVNPGDIVRFVQTGNMPHNVEFRDVPDNAALGDGKTGPYLTAPNQTYDVAIDERLPKGTYGFVCVPHEPMGMKGTIIVVAAK